jgi:hypothetical protein
MNNFERDVANTMLDAADGKIKDLEDTVAKYQACRVHDVDEKAWLSKRMSYFEDQLRSLLSPAAFEAILTTAPQTETSAQRPGVT